MRSLRTIIGNLKSDINPLYKWRIHHDIITLTAPIKSDKNVLLSYITYPFKNDQKNQDFTSHTNKWECQQIASTWLKYGYNVDVIDWDNSTFLPKKNILFSIDIHSNMERLAPILGRDCKRYCISLGHIGNSRIAPR